MRRIASLVLFFHFAFTAFAGPIVLPRRQLVGIGVLIGLTESGKEIWVKDVTVETPAWSAGIKPNMRITRIDDISTEGLSLGECVAKIRGPEGTKVKLEFMDPATRQTRVVELVRQPIPKR